MVPRDFLLSLFIFLFWSLELFPVRLIWKVPSSNGVWVTFVIKLVLDNVGIELWLGLVLVLMIHIASLVNYCFGLPCLSFHFLSSHTSQ